jgi:hypothetical protein
MNRTERLKFVAWWLAIGLIAVGACSLKWSAAYLGDEIVPVGNDSFYHARRILDAVANPAAFYQFDPKIHAPEGSLLTWPWMYDYGMAWLVKAASALGIPGSPLQILIWIPVAAVFLSVGLIMLIARRLGLSLVFTVLAGFAVALSPLTQFLQSVGQIDHHFAEYLSILATIACGLKWLQQPQDRGAAVVLGIVLGLAPGTNNGQFILQLPIVLTLALLWLQNTRMPTRTTLYFGGALLATTLALLLPSLPFRLGYFEFYTLSWFHLYVAAGTAIAAVAMAYLPKSNRNLGILALVAVVLLLPLAHQIVRAGVFLTGKSTRLETIVEMMPPLSLARSLGGRMDLTLTYSLLVWLTPLTVIYCAWMGWRERTSGRLLFWVCCILGLALLTMQLRLHYFGSFALYLPWLVAAQGLATRWPTQHKLVALLSVLGLLLAYWMPGRYQLALAQQPSADPSFRGLRKMMTTLEKACATQPGVVLADNDAGHYVRYYTECSVIANNFLLTPQHGEKIREIDRLTALSAAQLPSAAPYVRYVLVRAVSIVREGSTVKYMSYSQQAAPLIEELLLKPVEKVPAGYTLLDQLDIRSVHEDSTVPYVRLYRVERP